MPKSNRLLRSTLLDKKPFCKNEGINPATLLKWVYRLFKHFLGVAGYLPYVTNKYTNEKDFNNIKSVGSYPFGVALSGFSNIPNVASLEGLLIVIKSTSSNNIIQIYIGIQDNSCHLRTCYNGAWISWKKIV